jgi:3-oxoacyl-[acyl-carrier protein] reductase
MFDLKGKTALITGGGSGIGRGIGQVFAQAAANIIVNDIDQERAARVATELRDLGTEAIAIKADVADTAQVNRMVEEGLNRFGKIDILINNAGIGVGVLFSQMSKEEWDGMFAVHVGGAFNCTRALIQPMIDQSWGRIINISSVAGLTGEKGLVHYSAAKAALLGFTKSLAREVAKYNITVNAIAPGLIDTPLAASMRPDLWERLVKLSLIRRPGAPVDIAYACLYLASDEASFVTGQIISPNGGLYL